MEYAAFYLRRLTGSKRTESANRHLARYLAFVAGMADNFALGSAVLFLHGVAAVLSFLLGAFFTTLFVRWARARALDSEYAFPLLAEALLLISFGFT